ncbi:MAG: carbohydrate kinase family protein [Treponema sp.]
MQNTKIDVTALGEILIDFTPCGKSEDGRNLFEENPGGAPANCAAAVAKLGGKSAFIGMTGDDAFGRNARAALEVVGVDTSAMRVSQTQHTTLAFVALDENGERSFSFCRNPGADTQLAPVDLDANLLLNSRILHIGSLSLTDEPAKSATVEAVKIAKKAGALISYDPNWRKALWRGRSDAVGMLKSLLLYSDIVKMSEEELFLLFGEGISYADGAKKIMDFGARLALITLGSGGAYFAAKPDNAGSDEPFEGRIAVPDVRVIDTTGAGDCFTGALLYRLTRRENLLAFTEEEIAGDVRFASAAASICVTRRGAIPALPTREETQAFMREYGGKV